ncbi:MAG: hypothetical protein A2489_03430 [Candidatus Moranbacteria bacterium RIFOXYC12_FULL_36_13]|nr:MAG: hypothetical protein UR78_C0030G0001 [Candidatus Moranbacteria bacterium GW2011_GWF2_35_39]OGI32240.1 MAG: hypothetical protein A2343_01555 [Candidatus Moranbacteria bacterium RIFOXYB12_FULL_35_8]OGI33148.1 MAG: hypothetical protein A2489_03430 [Candidatus Moranbacteria bacterium RIFOXYC12_FULL_36_13]
MEKLKKQKSIDSFCQKSEPKEFSDYGLAKFIQKNKKSSVLFGKSERSSNFKTENLKLYFVKNDNQPNFQYLDGILQYEKIICSKGIRKGKADLYQEIKERYSDWRNYAKDFLDGSTRGVSLAKMWNVSIVASLFFGMFLMTFIYRYLGPNASAVSNRNKESQISQEVLGAEAEKIIKVDEKDKEGYEDYVSKIMMDYEKDSENEKKLKEDIEEMVKGYPIEKMAPFIAKQDRIVAAFLVAIAKKESNWGKRVPVLEGKDCYNYWGYRGIRKKMGTGGHTCFDGPKDAVETVAKRISSLVNNEKLNTPEKMIVWKCGYDCSWDKPSAMRKWVQDVDAYFEKFDEFEEG